MLHIPDLFVFVDCLMLVITNLVHKLTIAKIVKSEHMVNDRLLNRGHGRGHS